VDRVYAAFVKHIFIPCPFSLILFGCSLSDSLAWKAAFMVSFVHGQNKINRLGRLGNFLLYWMAASIIVVSDSDG
jgi:hypothetical protein